METVAKPTNLRVEAAKIKKVVVERPDLNNLDPWLGKYVTEPFGGFQDIPSGKGKPPVTPEQQLQHTHNQLKGMVKSNLEAHISPDAISDRLMDIVTPDSIDLNTQTNPTSEHK